MTAEPSIWDRRWVASTGSTNADLLRAAELGDVQHRTVLRADHQTAGRGRLDRQWDAPAGANLLASVYLDDGDAQPIEMMQRVGVAIVDAVLAVSGADALAESIGLKWPNDVLIGEGKLAGVLAQRSTNVAGIVVGFGVNVSWAPAGAARVGDHAAETTPQQLLDAVLAAFDSLPSEIGPRYRSLVTTIGQRVRVELPANQSIIGTATAINNDGSLQVTLDDGQVQSFDVGDVVHLRPTG